MRNVRPCYGILVSSDLPDGKGQPILMESNLEDALFEAQRRADRFASQYGDAWVIELPVLVVTEIVAVAGSASKIVYRAGQNEPEDQGEKHGK